MGSIIIFLIYSRPITPLTTSREQAGLQQGRKFLAEYTHRVKRLTIELPCPGRAVLIGKVEVRLRRAYEVVVGGNVLRAHLGDALWRKREILIGRPFLASSGFSRIGGYAWYAIHELSRMVSLKGRSTSVDNHLPRHIYEPLVDSRVTRRCGVNQRTRTRTHMGNLEGFG